jgi:hypothetical protein
VTQITLRVGDAFYLHDAGFGIVEMLSPQHGVAVVRMQNGAQGHIPMGMVAALVAGMPFVDECLQREVSEPN